MYLGSLASIYAALSANVIEWEQILQLWEGVVPQFVKANVIDLQEVDPNKGKLGVAVCLNPILEPFRIVLAIAVAKPLSRAWKSWRAKGPR